MLEVWYKHMHICISLQFVAKEKCKCGNITTALLAVEAFYVLYLQPLHYSIVKTRTQTQTYTKVYVRMHDVHM